MKRQMAMRVQIARAKFAAAHGGQNLGSVAQLQAMGEELPCVSIPCQFHAGKASKGGKRKGDS